MTAHRGNVEVSRVVVQAEGGREPDLVLVLEADVLVAADDLVPVAERERGKVYELTIERGREVQGVRESDNTHQRVPRVEIRRGELGDEGVVGRVLPHGHHRRSFEHCKGKNTAHVGSVSGWGVGGGAGRGW